MKPDNDLWQLPVGFSVRGVACGIKLSGAKDLGILSSEVPARAFAVYTKNPFCAPSVKYSREITDAGKKVSHVLVNSGNANACTGDRGVEDVHTLQKAVFSLFSHKGEVLIAQTGVIGKPLPMENLKKGIASLADLGGNQSPIHFAEAIMTTDTVPKFSWQELSFSERKVTVSGAAKGAGMICPNMATMLAFLMTDIQLPKGYLYRFKKAVDLSFNSISVDGDTSTNDMVVLLSNGSSSVRYEQLGIEERQTFDRALEDRCRDLAKQIVLDGEGSSKFLEVVIRGAPSEEVARSLGRAVSNSPLIKTALFGCDPNWGRVIATLGTHAPNLNPNRVKISICGISVFFRGCAADYSEKSLDKAMQAKEIVFEIDLGVGTCEWTSWTCDLSYDYVKINAEYHT